MADTAKPKAKTAAPKKAKAGAPAAASAAGVVKTKSKFVKRAKGVKLNKTRPPKAITPRPFKRYGRLWAKAIFTGFRRGLRNQHERQAILKIEGCRNRRNCLFYVGKRCVFVYKAKTKESSPTNPKHKSRLRAIWGNIIKTHGDSGSVRARFRTNLPGHAMGSRIRIMLYPSRI